MYQQRRSTVLGKYMLFLLGLINLGLGLYLAISKDSFSLLISNTAVNTNMQLFNNLILFSGVLLAINGLYNIVISLVQNKLIFYAAFVELIKGGILVYLEYFKLFTNFSLVRLVISLFIIILSLIIMIAVLKGKFTKKYIFFKN